MTAAATYDELLERRGKLHEEVKALVAVADSEDRDMTESEETEFKDKTTEIETLDRRAERMHKLQALDPVPRRTTIPEPIRNPGDPGPAPREPETRKTADVAHIEIPDNIRRPGGLRGYTRERFGEKHRERAYRSGRWFLGLLGHERSRQWCSERGMGYHRDTEKRAHTEGTNWQGGVLVPDEIDNDLIDLRESRGVFRRLARVVPMTSDTMTRRRRTGGLTAYAVGEASQITESTKSWDNVNLVAKKWGVITTISSELNEDAAISVGDDLASEIAYAFADKEDECGFNGDGTSTYHGILGVRQALKGKSGTVANIAGLIVSGNNTYGEVSQAELVETVALLPDYAVAGARWACSRRFFYDVMARLDYAAGGNMTAQIAAGVPPMFMGFPVEFAQVMPKTEANSQVPVLLGDFRLAADFGDRRGTTIAFSDSGTVGSVNVWEYDEISVRGTTRFDINVHDVGNASATAASQVPGPVVGLILKSS